MRKGFFFILALGYMFFSPPSLCLSQRAGAALADTSVAGEPMPSGAGKRPVIPGRDEGGRNFLPTDAFMKLLPLHRVKTASGPYDWLALHPEPGQDFNDYVSSDPVLPDDRHRFIYIILIGDFDDERKRIIEETAEFIQAYYTLPVKFLPAVGADAVPAEARRSHPQTRDQQILTTYVIESVLKPLKPEDAFCLIGFTAEDLWPGEGWNFVFGQASLPDRVGIWSIYRNGDPYESDETRKACLLRTIKTGVHEIGHMFSMHHCVFFECNMNGSNHRRESDARPVWLCPVCLRKLMWGLRKDPVARFEALEDICEKLDLDAEGAFFRDSKKAWVAPQ
ncbi:MAG: archaemetzincin [Candidatus Omnitrophota bacterium]|jgi:archaemetzincin